MTEARPHLVAVEDPPPSGRPEGSAGARGAPSPAWPGSRRPGRLLWLALGVALVCAVGWAVSAGRASRLNGELAASRRDLAAARERIGALEGHLGRSRDQSALLGREMGALLERAGALAGELDALGRLAARDPQAPGDARAGEAPAASAVGAEPAASPAGEKPAVASEASAGGGQTLEP